MDLPNPQNGIVTCSQGKEYQSICRFYCDQGHIISPDEMFSQVNFIYEFIATKSEFLANFTFSCQKVKILPSGVIDPQNLVARKIWYEKIECVSFLERSYLTVYILYKFAFFVPLLSYDFKELLTLFRENEILFSVIITQF